MEYDDLEEELRMAEGNVKHSGMYLTEGERDLIRLKAQGKIDQDEFIKRVLEYRTGNKEKYKNSNVNYEEIEEEIITPRSYYI